MEVTMDNPVDWAMMAGSLLLLGLLPMSQLRGGIGQWLFVSWVGIPGLVLAAGLLVNHPYLLFGGLVAIGLYALR